MKIGQSKREHKYSEKVNETIYMKRKNGSQVMIDIMKKNHLKLINEIGPTESQKFSESYEPIEYLVKTFEKQGFITDDITRADE